MRYVFHFTSGNFFCFAQVQFCISAILTHQYIPLQYFLKKSDNFLTLFFGKPFLLLFFDLCSKIFTHCLLLKSAIFVPFLRPHVFHFTLVIYRLIGLKATHSQAKNHYMLWPMLTGYNTTNLGARCRGFESLHSDQKRLKTIGFQSFFFYCFNYQFVI